MLADLLIQIWGSRGSPSPSPSSGWEWWWRWPPRSGMTTPFCWPPPLPPPRASVEPKLLIMLAWESIKRMPNFYSKKDSGWIKSSWSKMIRQIYNLWILDEESSTHIRKKRYNGRPMSSLFILADSPINFCLQIVTARTNSDGHPWQKMNGETAKIIMTTFAFRYVY